MTTLHRTLRWGLPLAAILTLASPASAASPQDQAAAEVLFNDAKKLADAGDFAHACPKFVESQRLDPTAGTALNVGKCFEGLGKVASAWGAYKDAEMIAHNAGDTAREAGAVKLSAALAPLLPKLAIVVPPVTRVPGFEVLRDGTPVGEGSYGSALPIDPGEHVIEASAPGKLGWTSRVMVSVSASITTEIPASPTRRGRPRTRPRRPSGAGSGSSAWRSAPSGSSGSAWRPASRPTPRPRTRSRWRIACRRARTCAPRRASTCATRRSTRPTSRTAWPRRRGPPRDGRHRLPDDAEGRAQQARHPDRARAVAAVDRARARRRRASRGLLT